jgi:hypothetical protein
VPTYSSDPLFQLDRINDLVRLGDLWVALGGWGDYGNYAGALAWTSRDLRRWDRRRVGPEGDLAHGMIQGIVVEGRIVAVGEFGAGFDAEATFWLGSP